MKDRGQDPTRDQDRGYEIPPRKSPDERDPIQNRDSNEKKF